VGAWEDVTLVQQDTLPTEASNSVLIPTGSFESILAAKTKLSTVKTGEGLFIAEAESWEKENEQNTVAARQAASLNVFIQTPPPLRVDKTALFNKINFGLFINCN